MDVVWAPWRMELIDKGSERPEAEGCIFCELPRLPDARASLIVHRTPSAFVILNRFPYNNGHVMVVPHAHVGDPGELDADAWSQTNELLRRTLAVLQRVYRPAGVNLGMNLGRCAGAGVPGHLHWHLVPRWDGDTNFMPVLADTKVMPEHLDRTWERLREAFEEEG